MVKIFGSNLAKFLREKKNYWGNAPKHEVKKEYDFDEAFKALQDLTDKMAKQTKEMTEEWQKLMKG